MDELKRSESTVVDLAIVESETLPARVEVLYDEAREVLSTMARMSQGILGPGAPAEYADKTQRRSAVRHCLRPIVRACMKEAAAHLDDETRIAMEHDCMSALESVFRRYGL